MLLGRGGTGLFASYRYHATPPPRFPPPIHFAAFHPSSPTYLTSEASSHHSPPAAPLPYLLPLTSVRLPLAAIHCCWLPGQAIPLRPGGTCSTVSPGGPLEVSPSPVSSSPLARRPSCSSHTAPPPSSS